MDPKELQNRIEGRVTISTDAAYPQLRRDTVWPQNTPGRYPRLIVEFLACREKIEVTRLSCVQRLPL